MDRYYSQIIGTPVMTKTGENSGKVFEIVFHTDTGKIAGFLLSPLGKKVVIPLDVIGWNHSLLIHDNDDIFDIEDIHQVMMSLKKNIWILKNRVITKEGFYLGKVINYAVHDKFFVLTKIVIAKSFLGIFRYDKKIISHCDIIEIRKDAIIVKNPLETAPLPKLSIDVAPTA